MVLYIKAEPIKGKNTDNSSIFIIKANPQLNNKLLILNILNINILQMQKEVRFYRSSNLVCCLQYQCSGTTLKYTAIIASL